MGFYDKLAKSGWLGTMPQISNELDSRKTGTDYIPDENPDAFRAAIKKVRQKTAETKASDSSGSEG